MISKNTPQLISFQQEKIKTLEEALNQVLDANRLDIAKEHAADALGVDLEEYLSESISELNFVDNDYTGDIDYSLLEEID